MNNHAPVPVGVLGASGYVGQELLRLLAHHPAVSVAFATAEATAGEELEGHRLVHAADAPLRRAEIVLSALPHGVSGGFVKEARAAGRRAVDLSADFRLSPEAIYGLTEFARPAVAGADLVANPGCYPTAALMALIPLAQRGLIDDTREVIIDAASGVTGNLGHRAVRRLKLDHLTKTFRFDNYWYYMLTGEVLDFRENAGEGRAVDGVYVSAVVDHASGSYLYRGIVSDFTFDRDGALDTIVLTDAHRRRLADDREEGEPRAHVGPSEPDERYYEIRGDFLVLRSAEIRTLNLDYFAVTLDESVPAGVAEGSAAAG